MAFVLRAWSTLALLGVLSLAFVPPLAAQQSLPALTANGLKCIATPQLTEDQAVHIAATFCQKMGLSVAAGTGAAKAETLFPDFDPYPLPSTYMHPLWRVIFPRLATVRIDDKTGNIAFYSDDLLWGRHLRDARPLTDVKVADREHVMENALMALDAMDLPALGPDEKLVLEHLQLRQDTTPPTVQGTTWHGSWLRLFQGLPFRGQNLTMQFDAESGHLFLLSLNYTLPAPRNCVLNISPLEASRLIEQHLSNALPLLLQTKSEPDSNLWAQRFKNRLNLPIGSLLQLEVVQPNDFWLPREVRPLLSKGTVIKPSTPTSSRVCWMGRYNVGARDYEVWVDAERQRRDHK
jgi:hypothetical protein